MNDMHHSSASLSPATSPTAAQRLHRGLNQLREVVTGVSVRTKIMGIVLALTVSLGLGVTLQVHQVMHEALIGELDNRGASVASDLAGRSASLILDRNIFGLNNLLEGTLRNHPDMRYAMVIDADGRVLAHTFETSVPPEILAVNPMQPHNEVTHVHYDGQVGQAHDFAMPILDGQLGMVRLGLSEARLLDIIDGTTRRMLLITVIVALFGIGAALLLTWLLTRPILDLVTTTEQLRQGNLSVRAPHWTDDEIGALSDAFNQMVSELEKSQQLVLEKEIARTHLLSRLISAQEEERKRIARELHDGVGQTLTSILVHIKTLTQNQTGGDRARLYELRQVVDETLHDVRMLSRELRPSGLDDLGLAAALERYTNEFTLRYPDLEIDLHCQLPQRLATNIEIALYRIIQEAMTNAARHSDASALSIIVAQRDQSVQAIVEDNGHGFDVDAMLRTGSSVGLHSMTERSELLGGRLDIESNEAGTTLYVEIPLMPNTGESAVDLDSSGGPPAQSAVLSDIAGADIAATRANREQPNDRKRPNGGQTAQ